MRFTTTSRPGLATLVGVTLALGACGGSNDAGSGGTPGTNPTPTASTAGLWKGTITSTSTGQTSEVVGLTNTDGHTVWMTTDGRVWGGQIHATGSQWTTPMAGHVYDGGHFPDGTAHGTAMMTFDHFAAGTMDGHFSGSSDTGTFHMSLSPMWNRPASLSDVAGVYTRSTSTGYSMTMTISANGEITADDTRGCHVNGTVTVPDPRHNLYHMTATVTSCGPFDGAYQGMGTLLDADDMRDWMSHMDGFEYGGHGMGGSHMMGRNTVPSGQHNLFMYSIVGDHGAMMDALAR